MAEQEEADRLIALRMGEEEAEEDRRQRVMEQQEANWLRTGMDWDQQFWDDYGFLPSETGADQNTTFLKNPCKKCDKKYITEKQLEEHMENVHKVLPTKKQDEQEYTCNNCDYKSHNLVNMKRHVDLHDQTVKCQECQYESKDTNEFIEHAIRYHSMQPRPANPNERRESETASSIKCYSCGEIVSSKRELTDHRRKKHFQQKLCRFYHGNGAGCRFPDSCIDIHGSRQQQRQSVIQENSQYRKRIPCRDGSACDWA